MKQKALQLARKLSTRMQGLNYLHRGIVLGLDLVCSTAAGLLAVIATCALQKTQAEPGALIAAGLTTALYSTVIFLIFRFYKVIIRHASLRSLPRIICALGFIALALGVTSGTLDNEHATRALLFAVCYFFIACALIIGLRIAMVGTYYSLLSLTLRDQHLRHSKKVFIYGHVEKAASLATYIKEAYRGTYLPAGIIDPDTDATQLTISELRVYGSHDMDTLQADIAANVPDAIIFVSNAALQRESDRIAEWCTNAEVQLYVIPAVDQMTPDAPLNITPVKIEDLLERPEIVIEEQRIGAQLTGRTLMVTGAAGSIGSEIVRQCCKFAPAKIILLDSAETPMHLIRLEIEEKYPQVPIVPIVADVRNRERCHSIVAAHRPAIIFHAAAYKHVPLMEENPCEAVITNVQGSINMAEIARECGVEKFVMISTDKAVNPTNVMGATKRAAEMYVQSLNTQLATDAAADAPHTRYITTRFGNVLGSNGSVVPRFREQIEKGGPVTVTHPDIIRFFMTIPEACRLVLQAGTMGHGGEIFVFDMGEPVKIAHLARRMIRLSGLKPEVDIKIEYTGLRPGEKLYEEVLSTAEGTTETTHHKIRQAQAIDHTHAAISARCAALTTTARALQVEETVRTLKALVPEFKSKNSPWEKFDK